MKYKYTKFSFLIFLCQAFQIAMVINKYKKNHTGPKTQSGGLKDGLFSSEYQGSLYVNVVIPPINEAEYVAIANKIKDKNLFLSIIILYIKSI